MKEKRGRSFQREGTAKSKSQGMEAMHIPVYCGVEGCVYPLVAYKEAVGSG